MFLPGVRVPDVHRNERVALELEERVIERIGDWVVLRGSGPGIWGSQNDLEHLRRGPLAHALDDRGRSDGPHAGEALADGSEPEPSDRRARG